MSFLYCSIASVKITPLLTRTDEGKKSSDIQTVPSMMAGKINPINIPVRFLLRSGNWKETRSMTVFDDPTLVGDEYGFFELYCNDIDCDCRRVMFDVVSRNTMETVAVIAYGWESKAFYTKWYHGHDDPEIVAQMQGPILNPGSPQSALAPALLEKVKDVLLKDPAYILRIKRTLSDVQGKSGSGAFSPASVSDADTPGEATSKSKRKHHRHRSQKKDR